MLGNLNRLSFAEFGDVLDRFDGNELVISAEWEIRHVELRRGGEEAFTLSDAETYMDYDTGMAILHVAPAAEPDEVHSFYLDKPVRIRPNVLFCITSLEEMCSVNIAFKKDALHEEIRLGGKQGEPAKIVPSFVLDNIATLFYQEKEKGFRFKGESHRQYELTYVDSGRMHSVIGGQDIEMSQGELMIYGPDQWHAQYADEEESACFVTISFDLECKYAPLLVRRKIRIGSGPAELLKKLLSEANKPDDFSNDMIISYLHQFLVLLLRQVVEGGEEERISSSFTLNNENHIVDSAIRFVSEHIYEKISVSRLAKEVAVSPSYLATLFQKHLDVSPGEYIRREKLEESKVLIKEGKLNFTQIADKLGYSTVHHFSNQFKAKNGRTPTEYSRAMKE